MTLAEICQECRDRGLSWPAVRDAYRELKAQEWEKRQRPNEIRETAWMLHKADSPGYWPFWRFGFADDFGKKIAAGADHTIIPGYDEIAQQIGGEFPEYDHADGTEDLWEFLLSPHDKLPDRLTLYRQAMDLVEAGRQEQVEPVDEPIPF